MEDDEDIELLRLAALKSLKKENVPVAKPAINIQESHVIPIVSHVRPPVDKFYAAPGEPELVQPNMIHHPVPPYVSSGFEKMEISDSFMPSRLNGPPNIAPYNEFAPFAGAATASASTVPAPTGVINEPSNVQLSPRSAAFVYENMQKIKRRQGQGISPAHSPVPFRKSPGRWSRSSSRESWKYRRSKSRSPAYPNHHSPHFRNRSVSRSPQRRRHSPPQPAHNRRNNRSRSPIQRNNFDANAHRSDRRNSPVPNRRGNNSPTNRHQARPWRGHSGPRDNGPHLRRSGSPLRTDERKRRTRSPTNVAKTDVRRRTTSRSPNRKFPRNNSNRMRRSPPKRFNNLSNGGKSLGHNGARNRNYHNQRSGSPNRNSHSPHHRRRSPARKSDENGTTTNKHGNRLENEHPMEGTMNEKSIDNELNETNENTKKQKTEQEIEDELLASSDSEHSNNDDGIDLFASEESESENEGRFKSNSSKSERKAHVPRVSFADLGKTTTASADVLLRDLDELQTDGNSSTQRRGGIGGSRRDNDRNNRNHSRRDDRRYNRDRDRENRDRERDRDRNGNRDRDRMRDRDRERESSKPKSSGSWKNSKNTDDTRKKDESVTETTNAKNDRKQTLFKSTFTSIEGESRTKTPDGGELFIFSKKMFAFFLKNKLNNSWI